MQKYYNSFTDYCKNTFQRKLYRVALDANMTCPNRDGRIDHRGCIFCDEGGSGDFAIKYTGQSLTKEDLIYNHQDADAGDYIAYFQAYTNTYAPVETLERLFSSALKDPLFCGLSIATRPDCIHEDTIALLKKLRQEYPDKFIWVELGLQTMHEETARFIRRGYPLSTFEEALNRLHAISVPVIVHVILGLPHESKEMMIKTCNYLNSCHIDGIKLQLLHVLKNTDLAALYEQKTFDILSLEEYIDIVITCLEVLSPDIVIHRVTGDGPKELLLAPAWSLNKRHVLNTLHQQLRLRDSWQGRYYESTNQ